MVVDFEFKRTPPYRVAYIAWKGAWKDATIRRNFEKVARWAKDRGFGPGLWVFREPGERAWETGVVVNARARAEGDIHLRVLPATRVASVVFDPDVVSPAVVYHGLTDWLRWRKKEKKIQRVVSYREVYRGNPWKDKSAYARTDIQFVVRP
ncbi:MAG TPA: GyrI-like domain-containing protein [Thermoplasmata archaeon]|nr:GyrI-like domain-containing protein [Thermoplasmata archaeon]